MLEQSAPAEPIVQPIAAVSALGDEAMALVAPEMQPRTFVDLLVRQKLYLDAVRFLAHALPKREAIWWAWAGARRAAGSNPTPKVTAALAATEKWIAQPTDENRRAARDAGEAAEPQTAAGCLGKAVFFSGGSLSKPGAPEVPPPEYLCAKMLVGAVIAAALSTEPEKGPEKFQNFISQGLEVAQRIKLWEPKKS
jgi:hypothetical protein